MRAWEQRMHRGPEPGKGLPLPTMGLAGQLEQLSDQGLRIPAGLCVFIVSRWDREGRERGAGRRQAGANFREVNEMFCYTQL